MNHPFFSIIITTYTRAGFIEQTIRTVLDQTFKDFEWLIVDDGSEDDTKNVVANFQNEAKFSIRYFWKKTLEKPAQKIGISKAMATYFSHWTMMIRSYRMHYKDLMTSGLQFRRIFVINLPVSPDCAKTQMET